MEAVQESSVQESSAVDQSSYVNDAFADYLGDPRDEEQAETPKTEEKHEAETPKEEEKTEVKPEEEAKPEEEKKDPFESAFLTESGDFDLDKLVGLSLDDLSFQKEEAAPVAGQAQDTVPQWQREYEEEKAFRQNINTSRLGPIESAFNSIQASEIPDEYKAPVLDALRQEYAKVHQENEQFFKERDEQSSFKRRQEEQEKIREEARAAKLPEISKANAMAVINKLPGSDANAKIELYNRIMFGPDAGGEILEDMFFAAHPDFGKLPAEKQNALKLRFVQELQADGARLQRHFNRAYRYLTADPKNMKRIMEQVSRTTDAQVRSNSLAAQKSPSGAVQRPAQKQSSAWDGYFADPGATRTRI